MDWSPPPPPKKPDPDVREAFEALEKAYAELKAEERPCEYPSKSKRKSSARRRLHAEIKHHPACQRVNELLAFIRRYPELTYNERRVYYERLDATKETIRLAANDARRTARAEAKAAGRDKDTIRMAGRSAAATARSAAERHAVEQALATARAVTKGDAT